MPKAVPVRAGRESGGFAAQGDHLEYGQPVNLPNLTQVRSTDVPHACRTDVVSADVYEGDILCISVLPTKSFEVDVLARSVLVSTIEEWIRLVRILGRVFLAGLSVDGGSRWNLKKSLQYVVTILISCMVFCY